MVVSSARRLQDGTRWGMGQWEGSEPFHCLLLILAHSAPQKALP